ncbi:MAG: hypothetical protein ABSF69_18935 [Polyangiaceae bacterium]
MSLANGVWITAHLVFFVVYVARQSARGGDVDVHVVAPPDDARGGPGGRLVSGLVLGLLADFASRFVQPATA